MEQEQNTPSDGRVILIDKPLEWTSFDVVKKVRFRLKEKKVGHGGTLDPLATGLLILCTGKKTKQINTFVELEKEYTGKMVIGKTTSSIDLETPFDSENPWKHITTKDCHKAILGLTGVISQIPPAHSAIKIDGKRAYKLARKGEEVKMKPREVVVREFNLTEINLPEMSFKIVCTKGTYIRSLVRDFGNILGTGAYLSELRRTRIGDLLVEDALKIDQLNQLLEES